MTSYIFGAGASAHAGYPLGTQLWSRLAARIIQNHDSDYRQQLDLITALYGPVRDVEALLTDISLGRDAFAHLTDADRNFLRRFLREAIREFFRHNPPLDPPLYRELATRHVEFGDVIITFNYELALERQLRLAKMQGDGPRKFEVPDGYAFTNASGTRLTSAVTVLKLHGSVNWLGQMFGGAKHGDYSVATNSLGVRPVLDPTDQEYLDYPAAPPCVDPEFKGGGYDEGVALILPTLEKRFEVPTMFGPEWRRFWDGLWDRASASLRQSDRIVLIGYSVREADVRARELILGSTNKDADVIVCCGTQSQKLTETFLDHGFPYVRSACTFENWLRHG